ncbi:MAG: GNAT family N-acetyltransferase [Candidatus Thorarchaeota archaeon]
MRSHSIAPVRTQDRDWVKQVVAEQWASSIVVTRSQVHRPTKLPGFVCWKGEERAGLVTYRIEKQECEIITLNSFAKREGVATELLQAVKKAALESDCHRLWVITTNDNLDALRFYQRRDFRITKVHTDALKESRRLKPETPEIGLYEIPMRDEIELEKNLN